jgi:hypothetical protein
MIYLEMLNLLCPKAASRGSTRTLLPLGDVELS